MPIAAAPAPALRPKPTPLPYRVPVREACVLVDGLVLSLDEWVARRPCTGGKP